MNKKIKMQRQAFIRPVIPFLIILSATFFLSDANIFRTFPPRIIGYSGSSKLLLLNIVGYSDLSLSCFGMGAMMLTVYRAHRNKIIPFIAYFWKFGGFLLCMGVLFLNGIINLYYNMMWISGVVLLFAAWFVIIILFGFIIDYPSFKQMKEPEEIGELAEKLNDILSNLIKKDK